MDQTNRKTLNNIFMDGKQKKARQVSNEKLKDTYTNAKNAMRKEKEK